MKHLLLGPVVAVLLVLGGCSSFYQQPRVKMESTPVVQLPQAGGPPPSSGAIFQASTYRPIFEDNHARLVGDTVTIQIVENINATSSSSSALNKSGTTAAGITAVPFLSAGALGRASIGASTAIAAAGNGANTNTNVFTGTITAVVIAVLPNGHLMISAEKQIGVNQNVDVLRFTGQLDPRAIGQGNIVASTAVANVRVEQRGLGPAADAEGIGWLSRFFLNLSPS